MPASRWWTDPASSRSYFPRLFRRCLSIGLLLAFLVSSGRGFASSEDACIKDDKCKDHYTKAVKFYKDEDYDTALTEFQAAYTARAMPLLLVNIGRTLQKLGRPKDALGYYERYLQAESKLDADTKKRVDEYITQVQALIGTESTPPTDKPQTVEPQQPVAPLPPPKPVPPPGRNLLIAGSVLAGVGIVGGLGAGIGLGVASLNQYSIFQNTTDEFAKLAARNSAESLNNGIIIAAILGTVVGATGVALIVVGARTMRQYQRAKKAEGAQPAGPSLAPPPGPPPAPPPQAMLVPWLSSTGAGLSFKGGF
jgi:tetratricopeptide (TPR) repeat protein